MREVICGPFHSGHRAEWARAIRERVQGSEAHAFLYLVPTRGLAGVVRELVLEGLPGLAGERVLTLFEVVEEILKKSDASYIRLDALAAERLVAKALRRLGARLWKGEPLETWAHSPGVVTAFRQHIGELKRACVEPQELVSHVAGTADEETMRVLADVYEAYHLELRERDVRLLDTEETYLEAARLLEARGVHHFFPGVEHVFIDYFTDFQPYQMRVVKPLLKAERVQMYVPYQASRWEWMEGIADLMQKSLSELAAEGLSVRTVETEAVPNDLESDIRAIQARLFAPLPERIEEKAPHVSVFPARTVEKEWLWVAKQMKRLHQSGVKVSDIAIVTNRELGYGSTAHRVLKQEGVPVSQAVTTTAEQVPWVRDLLALYTLADEDWHRDVVQQVASAEWLLGVHPLRGREMVPQRVAKQLGIVKGFEAWQTRVADLLAKGLPGEPSEEQVQEYGDLQALAEWLGFIKAKVMAIPNDAKGTDHVQAMRALLPDESLYLRLVTHFRAGDGYKLDYLQRDLNARHVLMRVLDGLDSMEQLLDEKGSYTRREFAQLLANQLQAEEITIERGKRAGVAFLKPSAARGLSYAHVFFVGLNEGEWPSPPSTPWLLRDSLREELAGSMALLAPQVQSDQEKLFFLMGLHTARKGVYASYVSASKQDLPSRFLDQLYELYPALEPMEATDEYLGGSKLFPMAEADVSNAREAKDWVAAQLAQGILSTEALLLIEPQEWQRIVSQADSERERIEGEGSGRFDGVLADEGIHQELAGRFSKEAVYSVSLFNRYGECGFKFYLSRVLTMEQEQEEDAEFSALEKGNLYHKVLYRLYQPLTAKKEITSDDIEALRAQVEPLFEAEWKSAQTKRRTEIGVRQVLEKERLLRRLKDWFEGEAEAWQTQGLPLVPRHLEWSFGMGRHANPDSYPEPIEVGGLKFRGQIDRIDATEDGQFFVVDYKTKGTKAIPKDIESGLDFQLPVYVRALEASLFEAGSAVGAGYFSIEKVDRKTSALVKEEFLPAFGMERKRVKFNAEQWEELLDRTERTLEDYRVQMTQGRFQVQPKDKSKCQFCEYQRICRFNALRALRDEAAAGLSEEGGEANG